MAFPTLNSNSIYSSIYNMILNQRVFGDAISGLRQDLANSARVEAGLHGDTWLAYDADCIYPETFTPDTGNLLAFHRNKNVTTEYVVVEDWQQISLTLDELMTKQAFASEGIFSQFNQVLLSKLKEAEEIYITTTYNTFIGNNAPKTITVDVASGSNECLTITSAIADTYDDMRELSREYNQLGYYKAIAAEDVDLIISSRYVNAWKKKDLPIVYNPDGTANLGGIGISFKTIHPKYLGRAVTASDKGSGKIITASDTYDNTKGKMRAMKRCDVKVSNVTYKLYAGDQLPNGTTVVATGATVGTSLNYSEVYIEDDTVIAICMQKQAVPLLIAHSATTSFWNPQNNSTNYYDLIGMNTLKALQSRAYFKFQKNAIQG